MGVARVLLVTSVAVAVAVAPAVPASAEADITWPQVQAAAEAAQTLVTQGGGTVTVEVSGKISYRRITDYRPGGRVIRERYREAGMTNSEPDEVTWTIAKKGVESRYQPMPPLPKAGRFPTLRNAGWVRVKPPTLGATAPPLLRLMDFDPLGAISASRATDAGIIAASWTHGIEGKPASGVTATFTQRPTGALVLQSFSTTDLLSTGPPAAQTVQVDFANPRLVAPDFSSALPEKYVDAALAAARDTTMAFYAARNAANSARQSAATMTRPRLIAYLRSQVAANEAFAHPPANPSTDAIANVRGGVRLTNRNAYSGRSTIWTISVARDKKVTLVKRTKTSRVTRIP